MIIIIVSTPVAVDPRRQVGSANPPILEVGSRLYIEPSTIRNRSTFYVKHTKMQDFGQNYSGDATPGPPRQRGSLSDPRAGQYFLRYAATARTLR